MADTSLIDQLLRSSMQKFTSDSTFSGKCTFENEDEKISINIKRKDGHSAKNTSEFFKKSNSENIEGEADLSLTKKKKKKKHKYNENELNDSFDESFSVRDGSKSKRKFENESEEVSLSIKRKKVASKEKHEDSTVNNILDEEVDKTKENERTDEGIKKKKKKDKKKNEVTDSSEQLATEIKEQGESFVSPPEASHIRKKKKKKHKNKEKDISEPLEFDATNDENISMKKKKHKHKNKYMSMPLGELEPTNEENNSIKKKKPEHQQRDMTETLEELEASIEGNVSKKKKKHKHHQREMTETLEELEPSIEGNVSKKKKKRKHKHNDTDNQANHKGELKEQLNMSMTFSSDSETSSGQTILGLVQKKVKTIKIENKETILAQDVKPNLSCFLKEEKYHDFFTNNKEGVQHEATVNPVTSTISPRPSSNNTAIQDMYFLPDFEKVGDELYSVCAHILKLNLPVSPLNVDTAKHHRVWKPEEKERLKRAYGAVFGNFWEYEDKKILDRLKELWKGAVVTDVKRLIEQINVSEDKDARNIVGLYVGQDLPCKLAHEICQRLVLLVSGTNLHHATYCGKTEMVGGVKRNPVRWSLTEDLALVEWVLKRPGGGGFLRVEQVVEKNVDWKAISEEIAPRTPRNARERWTKIVKAALIKSDQEAETELDYRKALLNHILELGVRHRKEINWKSVSTKFPPRTSSMLSYDLHLMTRLSEQTELRDQVMDVLRKMEEMDGKKFNQAKDKQVRKKEQKADLVDFYQSLF